MVGKVYSATVLGIIAELVEVQTDVSAGIPCFELTGNLSSTTKEAKERVKIALKNSKIRINPSRITINLIPANIHKDGPHFDFAMAVSILIATGNISDKQTMECFFAGELGLDGKICPVKAILPMILCARNSGIKRCFVPIDNIREARIVNGIEIIGVSSISEFLDIIKNGYMESRIIDNEIKSIEACNEDYSQIKGQNVGKRTCMIAAAARHNLLMIGPPGSGKSMLASRIRTIMPELTFEEKLRITSTYSVAGLLKNNNYLIEDRPFRKPYNTITKSAFSGGGTVPTPGEMSLSDGGILFLDEFNLFNVQVIDSMRIPLENHKISINRIHGTYEFPADFMLVAAMNPCKCGFYPDRSKCTCTEMDINRYFGKISKPIMDRIDICVSIPKNQFEDINGRLNDDISSSFMREKVMKAIEIQKERYKDLDISYNSELRSHEINKYCGMTEEASNLVKKAFDKLDLTARGYYKILKVARTIADLEGEDQISEANICEAIGYKSIR